MLLCTGQIVPYVWEDWSAFSFWVKQSIVFSLLDLNMMAPWFVNMWATRPATWCHIQEDLNLWQCCCENLKFHCFSLSLDNVAWWSWLTGQLTLVNPHINSGDSVHQKAHLQHKNLYFSDVTDAPTLKKSYYNGSVQIYLLYQGALKLFSTKDQDKTHKHKARIYVSICMTVDCTLLPQCWHYILTQLQIFTEMLIIYVNILISSGCLSGQNVWWHLASLFYFQG
jgi:hypothetical protein